MLMLIDTLGIGATIITAIVVCTFLELTLGTIIFHQMKSRNLTILNTPTWSTALLLFSIPAIVMYIFFPLAFLVYLIPLIFAYCVVIEIIKFQQKLRKQQKQIDNPSKRLDKK